MYLNILGERIGFYNCTACSNIYARYGVGPKPQQTTLLIRAFLFDTYTYCILYLLYSICGKTFGYDSLALDDKSIDLIELKDKIAFSVPLSLALSIVWLYSVKYRWVMKIFHRIGVSSRFGDEDVWSFTFNTFEADKQFVHIRDLENGFIFEGWVDTYSENEEIREILLREAITYNESGDKISEAPFLYLSRPKQDFWIEFPIQEGETDVEE